MNKATARTLRDIIQSNVNRASGRHLVTRLRASTPFTHFHQWANGRPLVGAYQISRHDESSLVALLIDWKSNGDWYLILCHPVTRAPLAELHTVEATGEAEALTWRYRPSKRDGKNPARVRHFRERVGSASLRLRFAPLPHGSDDLFDQMFILVTQRLDADAAGEGENETKGDRTQTTRRSTQRAIPKPWVPVAVDIAKPPRREQVVESRVVRDSRLTRWLKTLHNHKCQICGKRLELSSGDGYSEAHHLKPLGNPHSGPDVPENLLIVCPNCHALCDMASLPITRAAIRAAEGHRVGAEFLREPLHKSSRRLI